MLSENREEAIPCLMNALKKAIEEQVASVLSQEGSVKDSGEGLPGGLL